MWNYTGAFDLGVGEVKKAKGSSWGLGLDPSTKDQIWPSKMRSESIVWCNKVVLITNIDEIEDVSYM